MKGWLQDPKAATQLDRVVMGRVGRVRCPSYASAESAVDIPSYVLASTSTSYW